MAHKTHHQWNKLIFVVMSLLVSVACLSGTAVSPRTTSLPDPTATPVGNQTEVNLEVGPGSLFYPDPRAGLLSLSSYKATLLISFDGTENGQPRSWSKVYELLYSKEPEARLLTAKITGISTGEPAFLAEMNGVAYEITGSGACRGAVLDPTQSTVGLYEPAGMLTGILGAQAAGHETVNGIEADHYTFDERALTQAGINQSTGEIWIATSGGQIERYLLTTTGNENTFGEGFSGSMHWDYQLTEVNQTITFSLPADCPPGLVGVPRLADASNVLSLLGFLKYNTESSLSEVVAFYQAKMAALGWSPLGETAITDSRAFFEFTQGDQTLSIVSVKDGGSTTVQIAVSRSGE